MYFMRAESARSVKALVPALKWLAGELLLQFGVFRHRYFLAKLHPLMPAQQRI